MFSVPCLAFLPFVIYPMHLFTDQWHIFSVEPTIYIFYGIISFANQTVDAALEIWTSIFSFLASCTDFDSVSPRQHQSSTKLMN